MSRTNNEFVLNIKGMDCASCAKSIETGVGSTGRGSALLAKLYHRKAASRGGRPSGKA